MSLAVVAAVLPQLLAASPHGPISWRYNESTWCSVGGVASPPDRPASGLGWERCAGAFNATSDNYTEADVVVGETSYLDGHGLHVQVSWKHFINASRGIEGSREWAVELRCDDTAVCDGRSTPPDDVVCATCGVCDAPPPPPCPPNAADSYTAHAGFLGSSANGCSDADSTCEMFNCTDIHTCVAETKRFCSSQPTCHSFAFHPDPDWPGYGGNRSAALVFRTGLSDAIKNAEWTTYQRECGSKKAAAQPLRSERPATPRCLPVCGPYTATSSGHDFDWPGPILADLTLPCSADSTVILHRQLGSSALADDFSAIDTPLALGDNVTVSVGTGRSSDGDLPVWNIEVSDGQDEGHGVVAALGWSGNWRMVASRAADGKSVRLVVTPGTLCASLSAGESVSLGRVLTVPWSGGDYRLGYVLLRRLMSAHKVPRLADGSLPHFLATESYDRWRPTPRNESNVHWVQELAARGGLDTWWMDANWFRNAGGLTVGNWRLPLSLVEDTHAFPHGVRALFEHARNFTALDGKPMRALMWTEPERVSANSWIHHRYSELLFQPDDPTETTVMDLGNRKAMRYIQEWVSAAIAKYKLDVWRVDFNIDPAPVWFRTGDSLAGPDVPGAVFRRGINEAGYVSGLYDLWDRVRDAHPGLIIDNCASGGRRHDLETMSRSVPLWPTDFSCAHDDPAATQSMTMGLSRWLPVHGGAFLGVDPYAWRSVGIGTKNADWGESGWQAMAASPHIQELMRNATAEARELEAFAADEADFWPLTPIMPDPSTWAAWELHRPHRDDGYVMYFRRANANATSFAVPWVGLSPRARYSLEYRAGYSATAEPTVVKGSALVAGRGLRVELPEAASSLLIRFHPAVFE